VWFKRYRLLVVIWGIALVAGVREYRVSREMEQPVDFLTAEGASFADVMSHLNPDDPDTDFLQGMQALFAGDPVGFRSGIEDALASDIKHNEMLLQFYGQYLVNEAADWREVNPAINRWRTNFPFSKRTITLQFTAGPPIANEAAVLRQALSRVPWIADSDLQLSTVDGDRVWTVTLMFRRGETVDVRQALAAMNSL